ncbi:MAG: hypothetical protein KDC53_21120 [Saprospiraceae bacterium]|nr:hypothetical protein [Saprospiraceae bacterium]
MVKYLFLAFLVISTLLFKVNDVKGQTLRTVCRLPAIVEETSGIEYVSDDIFWTFNDSGGEPELYLCDTLGNLLKTVYIQNAWNRDWEDITQDVSGNLYIGNVGNNENKETDLTIFKIANPIDSDSAIAEIITFRYEDQHSFPPGLDSLYFDCESLMWWDHHLYLCTKNRTDPFDGLTLLYCLPDTAGTFIAEKIGVFDTGGSPKENHWITAGDISDDGRQMCLLSSDKIWLFYNYEDDHFFSGEVRQINLGHLSQKEAICFLSDKQLLITDEEGPFNSGRNLYLYSIDSQIISHSNSNKKKSQRHRDSKSFH